MKKSLIEIANNLVKSSFFIFVIGIGLILPLSFNNFFYDLIETKAYAYFVVSIVAIIPLLIAIVLSIITKNRMLKKEPLFICIVTFAIVTLISTILSYSPKHALIGDLGWYVGSYTTISLILFIIFFSNIKLNNDKLLIPTIIGITIVYIVAIGDTFELNLLNFKNADYSISNHSYISLIGNVNWFTGYLSLTLPVICGLYINEENKKKRTLLFILSILAVGNLAFIKSDGIYLAIGFLSFFIIPFVFDNLEKIKRFSYLLFSYSIFLIISRILNFYMDGLCIYTRKLYIIIPMLLLSVFLYFFSTSTKNKKYNKNKKIVIAVLETILFITCIILMVFIINSNNINWSNGRLIIWKKSFEAFINFPIKNKLFGTGPELLYNVYSSLYDEFGIVQCSHSEPIQVLLSMGIFGSIAYISCWINIFIYYYKNRKTKVTPLFFGIICYFAQSFINSATTLNIATLSLLIIVILIKESD